ncbi:MAG: phosphonate degradation HD-domain oxygenase [Spirulina sp.]
MNPTIETIFKTLRTKGGKQYGSEAVSQLEHALQCATLAESERGTPELIVAALLHDLGHLLHDLGEDVSDRGIDDRHEYRCLGLLTQLFPPAVTEPIRLHVEAKRYLCAVEATYWQELSPASKQSLKLQGEIFSPEQARHFKQHPHAEAAIQLRKWDDRAKIAGKQTPALEHFLPVMEHCAIARN